MRHNKRHRTQLDKNPNRPSHRQSLKWRGRQNRRQLSKTKLNQSPRLNRKQNPRLDLKRPETTNQQNPRRRPKIQLLNKRQLPEPLNQNTGKKLR